ncbi:MAG: acetyltransferase [Candidatus Paceibacterota bacterium]|jgi:sugar O-acyltransferase (sialic acid O-acetyltransferase NeuD family)
MHKLIIYGAGGHGKVIANAVLNDTGVELVGFVDQNISLTGKTICGHKVLGLPGMLPEFKKQGIDLCIIAIGDNKIRMELAARVEHLGFKLYTAIHPRAIIAPSAKIGKGTAVLAGALINPDAIIGNNVIINTGAIIEHDNVIKDNVHIAPGAMLAGEVEVGKLSFVGMGAKVKECQKIGAGCVIGMGAVVIDDIPDNSLAVGIPAKTIKHLS